jgi:hypothetical protein
MERGIINAYGNLNPSNILRYFTGNAVFQMVQEREPYTFIILGRGGPTGKTWLCNGLRKYGFMAFELSESILPLVDYKDNRNHVIRDGVGRSIIIVLNRNLKE